VITLGQTKSDNNNRLFLFSSFKYMGHVKCDHIKRMITFTSDNLKRLSLYNFVCLCLNGQKILLYSRTPKMIYGFRHGAKKIVTSLTSNKQASSRLQNTCYSQVQSRLLLSLSVITLTETKNRLSFLLTYIPLNFLSEISKICLPLA
jgi:hypothetical protein